MNRFIQILNLVGIAALAALCCAQWRENRRLNLRTIDLEKTHIEQSAQIAEQGKTIKGQSADLDDFRQRLQLSESALNESEEKFTTLAAERDKLIVEHDQLKTALDKWTAAVAERDGALKQASDQITKLAADRNDAIAKFNDLANRYNALVKPTTDAQNKTR